MHKVRLTMLAVLWLGTSCQSHTPETSANWFNARRNAFEQVRKMLSADEGHLTSVQLGALGGLHGAGGTEGFCGSELRGNDFPWKCTHGVTVKNLKEVEAYLHIPTGRLTQYQNVLPAKSVRVNVQQSCWPPGSVVFDLSDVDSPPCTGLSTVLWSRRPPVLPLDSACQRTVAIEYVPLGAGWYAEACVR